MMYLIGGGSRAESYKNMKNWRFRGETLEQMHDIPFQELVISTGGRWTGVSVSAERGGQTCPRTRVSVSTDV